MRLGLSSWLERVRASFFFVPMVAVIGAVALGLLGLSADRWLQQRVLLPPALTSTVGSARALLSTIAGATITFAGIAFSISVLIIQLASSQYSPRVVHTLFRDPFNRRVMALVVGTFTYCVIVLRSVRLSLAEGRTLVIPDLSVVVAVLLGIISILAVVAFINHSAHAMDVSEILARVRRESIGHIRREWSLAEPGLPPPEVVAHADMSSCQIRFDRTGWVQQVDADALLACIPAGGIMQVEAYPGRYAIEGTPLCTLAPVPDDLDQATRHIRSAVALGDTRNMQQDVSYGLRQLADVALKALSPGINDPTTAQDAIFHTAAVLAEVLKRDPPPMRIGKEERRLVMRQQPTHHDLVRLAFDETRRAASSQPAVCVYLLEALELLTEPLQSGGLADRTEALADQARLVVAGCEAADLLADDLEIVRGAFRKRFGNG